MKEFGNVASRIECALHDDPRTYDRGIRVEVDDEDVVLRGEVTSEERRQHVAGNRHRDWPYGTKCR
jgi:hypothetical protein